MVVVGSIEGMAFSGSECLLMCRGDLRYWVEGVDQLYGFVSRVHWHVKHKWGICID